MPNLNRDEQKAVDLLAKAESAVLAFGFELDVDAAIRSMFSGIQNYVIGLAHARENSPATEQVRYIHMEDSGEGKDTSGSAE